MHEAKIRFDTGPPPCKLSLKYLMRMYKNYILHMHPDAPNIAEKCQGLRQLSVTQ